MTDIYSPQSNTVPGQQVGNMTDILSGITGNIPAGAGADSVNKAVGLISGANTAQQILPQAVAQDQQQINQQPGIQQPVQQYGDLSKLYAMFAADQKLSQNYMRPDFNQVGTPSQTPSDYPSFPGMQKPEMGVLTNSVIAGGAKGPEGFFTSPDAGTAQAQMVGTGTMGAINNINTLLKFNTGQGASQLAADTANWKDKINQNLNLANMYMTLYNTTKGGGSMTAKEARLQMVGDIKNGMTLDDAMNNYREYGLSSKDILNLYDQYNTFGTGGKRKPHVEDPHTLYQNYGLAPSASDPWYASKQKDTNYQNLVQDINNGISAHGADGWTADQYYQVLRAQIPVSKASDATIKSALMEKGLIVTI